MLRSQGFRPTVALATRSATFMNRWSWLAEQPYHLPHKRYLERRDDDVAWNTGKRNYQGISTGNLGIRQWQLPGPPRGSSPACPPSPNLHAWSSSHARTLNPNRRSWLCTAGETLGELTLSMCSLQSLRIDMPGHLPWHRVLTYQS